MTSQSLFGISLTTTSQLVVSLVNAFQLRNREIKRFVSVKFLGVIVREHLSWKPHMEVLLSKIGITCSIVHIIRNDLGQRILLLMYNSLIKSHL